MSARSKILLAIVFLLLVDACLSWWLIRPSTTSLPVTSPFLTSNPSLLPTFAAVLPTPFLPAEIKIDAGRYQVNGQSFLNGVVQNFDSQNQLLTLVSNGEIWSLKLSDQVKINQGNLTDLQAGQIVWLGLTADNQIKQITFVKP